MRRGPNPASLAHLAAKSIHSGRHASSPVADFAPIPTVSIPRAAQNPWIVTALIGVLCLVWGSTWLAIKFGLEDLPPFTSASARFGLAWFVMFLIAPRIARIEGGERPDWGMRLATGIGQFVLSYGIVYWSEQVLPSALVSVLWSVFPLMVAGLGAWYLPGERLGLRQWAGFVIAFLGIVMLFFTDVRNVGASAVPAGLVLMLSPAVTALSTVYIKKRAAGVSSILLNRDAMGIGAVGLLIGAVAFEWNAEKAWTSAALASIGYLALIGTCLTFGIYLWLMRYVSANKLSLIAYVAPMVALWLGAAFGNEVVRLETVLGAGVIVLGVACAATKSRVERAEVPESGTEQLS